MLDFKSTPHSFCSAKFQGTAVVFLRTGVLDICSCSPGTNLRSKQSILLRKETCPKNLGHTYSSKKITLMGVSGCIYHWFKEDIVEKMQPVMKWGKKKPISTCWLTLHCSLNAPLWREGRWHTLGVGSGCLSIHVTQNFNAKSIDNSCGLFGPANCRLFFLHDSGKWLCEVWWLRANS